MNSRIAEALLNSLDALSEDENQQIWVDEALRRDAVLDANPDTAIPARDVFLEVRERFG